MARKFEFGCRKEYGHVRTECPDYAGQTHVMGSGICDIIICLKSSCFV